MEGHLDTSGHSDLGTIELTGFAVSGGDTGGGMQILLRAVSAKKRGGSGTAYAFNHRIGVKRRGDDNGVFSFIAPDDQLRLFIQSEVSTGQKQRKVVAADRPVPEEVFQAL